MINRVVHFLTKCAPMLTDREQAFMINVAILLFLISSDMPILIVLCLLLMILILNV